MIKSRLPLPTVSVAVLVCLLAVPTQISTAADTQQEEFTVDFYYKVKWGYFNEFYRLYKKNHYPILKRLQDMGRIVRMEAVFPINHAGEADRWDMRFTIVYPNVAIAHEDFDRSSIVAELYPDQETFRTEEQRRFELLLGHTDIPVRVDDLVEWDGN